MKLYEAEAVFPVGSGTVGMTKEQARRRLSTGMLAPRMKGKTHEKADDDRMLYDVQRRFEVKAGEVFAWDEDPGKGAAVTCLTPDDESAKTAAAGA